MNKYLKRGIVITAIGIALGALGAHLKELENDLYSIVMTLGVIIFGVGFLTIIYSLIRKIERQSILESRMKNTDHNEG